MGAENEPIADEWNASLSGDYLWSNVNFGEAVSEPMTPLSSTVLRHTLADWVFLPGHETVGNIGGRPYLNISIFATVFKALGRSQEALLKTLESTLYMRLPAGMEIPLLPVSVWSLPAIVGNLLRIQARQTWGVRRLPRLLAENRGWFAAMRQQILDTTAAAELVTLWHGALWPHVARNVWTILGSATHSSEYTMRLSRELSAMVGPDDAGLLIAGVSDRATAGSDSGLLASLGPAAGLARLARGEMTRQAYLEAYGYRGPHEFELSVPRPVEDPRWLEEQLARFRASPVDVAALLAEQCARFDAAWGRFEARYPRQAGAMRRRIDEAACRARQREAARSEYVRDRWAVRLFALRAGELSGLGDGVFFLTVDELLNLLAKDGAATGAIPARRETYRRLKTLPAYPPLIRGRFDPWQWAQDPARRSDVFDASRPAIAGAPADGGRDVVAGAPGSAGRAEGLVRRLDSPAQGNQLQRGEILVAAQTDIAWTPLFPLAAAVVTDVGAPLSHAAIVARELGIPAVVGCGDATMRLQTGDRVLVDGGTGKVRILAAKEVQA